MNSKNFSILLGIGFCVFAFVVMILWMFTYINIDAPKPYCPQEDSCYADYDGPSHSWIIYEGERPTPEQVLYPN